MLHNQITTIVTISMAASGIQQFTKKEIEIYDECPICTDPITLEHTFMVTTFCYVAYADYMLTWCLNQPTDKMNALLAKIYFFYYFKYSLYIITWIIIILTFIVLLIL